MSSQALINQRNSKSPRKMTVEYHRPSSASIREFSALIAESDFHQGAVAKSRSYIPSRRAPPPPSAPASHRVRTSLRKTSRQRNIPPVLPSILEHDPFAANSLSLVDTTKQTGIENAASRQAQPGPTKDGPGPFSFLDISSSNITVEYHRPSSASIRELNALIAESDFHQGAVAKSRSYIPSRRAPPPPSAPASHRVRTSLRKTSRQCNIPPVLPSILEHDPFTVNPLSLVDTTKGTGIENGAPIPPRPSRANTANLIDIFSSQPPNPSDILPTPSQLAACRQSKPSPAKDGPNAFSVYDTKHIEYPNSNKPLPNLPRKPYTTRQTSMANGSPIPRPSRANTANLTVIFSSQPPNPNDILPTLSQLRKESQTSPAKDEPNGFSALDTTHIEYPGSNKPPPPNSPHKSSISPSQGPSQQLPSFSFADPLNGRSMSPNVGASPGVEDPRLVQSDGLYLEILNHSPDQEFLRTFLCLLVARRSISGDNLSNDDSMLMNVSRIELREKLRQMRSILKLEPYTDVLDEPFLHFLQDPSRSSEYHVSKTAGTRRYLELITKLLIEHAARLTKQPDFHGIDHFDPEFGKLINHNPQAVKLDIEDWEQILRPLLNVLDKLLVPSNIDSLMDGYCQRCQFFQITYDILTHLKSLREKQGSDVEKYLKSVKKIIRYGGCQNFDMNFGRVFFGWTAIVGSLMAVLAHQR